VLCVAIALSSVVRRARALEATSACACPTSGTEADKGCAISSLVPADDSSTCDPTSLDASGFLDENIVVNGNTFIRTIDFGGLKRLGGDFVVRESRFVTSIAAPDLEETTSGDVRIEGAIGADDFLQTIDFTRLRVVGGSFAVVGQTHASFASLDVSALETVAGYFNVSDNTNLALLNVKSLRRVSGGALKITGNANALSVRANCGVESAGLVNGVVTDSAARASSTFSRGSVSYCSLCTFEDVGWQNYYDNNGNYVNAYGARLAQGSGLKAYNSSYSCDSTLDANGFLNENLTLVVNQNDVRYDLSALKHIAGDLRVSYEYSSMYGSSSELSASQCNSTSAPSVSSWLSPRNVSVFLQNLERVDGALEVSICISFAADKPDESRSRALTSFISHPRSFRSALLR